jgi:hypothetical protein
MHRSLGHVLVAIVSALLGLMALGQMVRILVGQAGDPRPLVVFQGAMGVTAIAVAVGSWRAAPWAPLAALLYGVITASMLLSLAPMLNLEPEARGGLRTGAATMFALAIWAAWYLRRSRLRA